MEKRKKPMSFEEIQELYGIEIIHCDPRYAGGFIEIDDLPYNIDFSDEIIVAGKTKGENND
jgi:alpha-D-ribose 1-methylphosphonate 5-triphosphate synthase subunit PhnI